MPNQLVEYQWTKKHCSDHFRRDSTCMFLSNEIVDLSRVIGGRCGPGHSGRPGFSIRKFTDDSRSRGGSWKPTVPSGSWPFVVFCGSQDPLDGRTKF